MLFSYRNNLIDNEEAFRRFCNRIWNAFDRLLDFFYNECGPENGDSMFEFESILFKLVADKMGIDVASQNIYAVYSELHNCLEQPTQLSIALDFIEAHLDALYDTLMLPYLNIKTVQDCTMSVYNRILRDENQPYEIRNNQISPIISELEFSAIESASSSSYDSVNLHIVKAWEKFANRKSPDYENSIKESISAVEAICCIITGMTGAQATLGNAIKRLKDKGVYIHPAMASAFSSLYGYTSDENGIRHGGIDFKNAPPEDAKYMLVSCSAFVNYLVEKWSKVS